MSFLRGIVTREPAASLTVMSWAAGAICALAGHAEFAPVLVAVGAAFLGVRTQVVPKVKAAEVTNQAATTAAIEVAKGLTADIAGDAGEVTGGAAKVVDDVLEALPQLIGGKTK